VTSRRLKGSRSGTFIFQIAIKTIEKPSSFFSSVFTFAQIERGKTESRKEKGKRRIGWNDKRVEKGYTWDG
jgi:hypothetical protein